ncbi:Uncharacterized protein HZ326_28689 [Fusarium oxysporum f. sp. albedinis]|nr:Uncharacterized protein HZ326_28689 [Fusarium oxysporum f. sp. albedinis]
MSLQSRPCQPIVREHSVLRSLQSAHSDILSSIESIQLLKNWIRGGCVTLGGLCLSNKAVRSHGQNREAGNSST